MTNTDNRPDSKPVSSERVALLLSVAALVVGTVGYFLLQRDFWIFYFFAHLGALGVMGLFGCVAGSLAKKKGRSYWMAFSFGCLLPIISGIVAVLIFYWGVNGRLYCGGSVSLAVAIPVVLFYLVAKKKTLPKTGEA